MARDAVDLTVGFSVELFFSVFEILEELSVEVRVLLDDDINFRGASVVLLSPLTLADKAAFVLVVLVEKAREEDDPVVVLFLVVFINFLPSDGDFLLVLFVISCAVSDSVGVLLLKSEALVEDVITLEDFPLDALGKISTEASMTFFDGGAGEKIRSFLGAPSDCKVTRGVGLSLFLADAMTTSLAFLSP